MSDVRAVGADAYAEGWVAVALTNGRVDRVWCAPTLSPLLSDEPSTTVVGIDLPLGGTPDSFRHADSVAKRLLGAQHAKVFSVPPRPVWDAPSYMEANAQCRRLTGVGLSVQAYRLVPKMLDAERYRDEDRHQLHEIHPELVFRALAGGPLPYGKKTWNGQMLRRGLLARVGVRLATTLSEAGAVPPNDVLDAAAVAWCAHRIALGFGNVIPDPADQYDHRGRPIVIWYP